MGAHRQCPHRVDTRDGGCFLTFLHISTMLIPRARLDNKLATGTTFKLVSATLHAVSDTLSRLLTASSFTLASTASSYKVAMATIHPTHPPTPNVARLSTQTLADVCVVCVLCVVCMTCLLAGASNPELLLVLTVNTLDYCIDDCGAHFRHRRSSQQEGAGTSKPRGKGFGDCWCSTILRFGKPK